jgi:hypothetical protein
MQPSRHAAGVPTEAGTRSARTRGGGRPFDLRRAGVPLLALLLGPLAGCAEEVTDGAEEAAVQIAADADPQELMAELQGIQQELSAIQQRAMQDPGLQAERDSLQRRLETKMAELDPEAAAKQERQVEIATEFEAAREAGEEEAVQELAMENREIQASLQETRQTALETEEMSAAVASFQEEMLADMNEVDPRTDSLVARAEAIVAHLQERMAEQGAAPPEAAPDTT